VYQENLRELRWGMSEAVWRPPTDVYETDDSVVVVVEIAGLTEGDYTVTLSGRTLLISGERRDPAERLAYQQMEIRHGRFRTQVHLPWALEPQGQQASYANGFLRVVLSKAQVRRVPVRASESQPGSAQGPEGN
jgi:HSP20 family protein